MARLPIAAGVVKVVAVPVVAFLLLAGGARASAEEIPPSPLPSPLPDEVTNRSFVAGSIDMGFLYLRPRFSFGYGTPFGRWVGVDLNPIASTIGLGAYGGVRLALPQVNLRVGARYYSAFQRSYLTPSTIYTRIDIEDQSGDPSHYLSVEGELSGDLPAGPGKFTAEVAATAVLLVPEGFYVFEETLRTVVAPPWVGRARVGYRFVFGPEGSLQVGPVFEVVWVPGRDYVALRAGLTVRLPLWKSLELRATLVPPISSRDRLGTHGGDTFLLGIRWRWASG